jgi:uncharacterized membrane protein YphA (DoxX/SURF4 family)
MNSATKFFLVLLRIAIGWHLLFAGIAKFAPDYRGSEGYLQEATGPLAPYFHQMVGDKVADRYAVETRFLSKEKTDPNFPYNICCPIPLAEEWDDYCRRFIAHYHLDAESSDPYSEADFAANTVGLLATPDLQGGLLVAGELDQPHVMQAALRADAKLFFQQKYCRDTVERYKYATVYWMLHGSKPRITASPWGPPVVVDRTPLQRVADYQAKREEIRKEQAGEVSVSMHTTFGADKTKELIAEKADVARTRADLAKELDTRTSALKEALHDVLTPEQAKKYGPMPEPPKPSGWSAMSRLDWIDFAVRWGLVLCGSGLILGLFSRISCLGGAVLLLSFYLAAMPLPGVIEAVRVEGYPYVNKNIVEMLALLTLATTASGRWVGLDFLICYFSPFRRRKVEPKGPPPPPESHNRPLAPRPEPVLASSHAPSRR